MKMKMKMEESERCGEAQASWRWNPTKEQIRILENLYEEGLRTPNAQQIQHITAILRAYCYIEAKNVFYWFQNHKARQRQREMQNHNHNHNHNHQTLFSYFNRFLLSSPQHPIVLLDCESPQQRTPRNLKTLPLFPLHPTGVLEGKTMEQGCSLRSVSADSSTLSTTTPPSHSSDVDEEYGRSENQPFFDFFSLGQGSQAE